MEIKVERHIMWNLEQIRAKNALKRASEIKLGSGDSKTVAKEVPAMIVTDGFLGALAFAVEKKPNKEERKNLGHYSVFEAILEHLKDPQLNLNVTSKTVDDLLRDACEKWDADMLRAVTSESMAYLNYLRRFAKPGKEEESHDGDRAQ